MLYKSPSRRHRCHYVSFASKEVEVRKERKETFRTLSECSWSKKQEDQKNNLCLCEVQSETEEVKQQKSKKVESQMPKKTVNSKSHHH